MYTKNQNKNKEDSKIYEIRKESKTVDGFFIDIIAEETCLAKYMPKPLL